MVLLKRGGGHHECTIGYFPNHEAKRSNGTAFILWHTILFVGWGGERYGNFDVHGLIQMTLPVGSKIAFPKEVYHAPLYSFQHMDSMGVIRPTQENEEPVHRLDILGYGDTCSRRPIRSDSANSGNTIPN
jgi:hypothetical protein